MTAGDVLTLQWSQSETFASGLSSGTYTWLGTEAPGNTLTGFAIPTLSTGAPWYFRLKNVRGSVPSLWSSTVAWNTSAATITSGSTFSVAELSTLAFALTASQTGTWSIYSGSEQLQYQITGSTLTWLDDGTQNCDRTTALDGGNDYVVTVRFTNLQGITTDKVITGTVTAIDKTPTFTPSSDTKANATDGVDYTSATTTVSGLATGITVPGTVATFQFSKNGGGFQAPGTTTMTNGDTFALKGSTSGGTATGTLTGSPGAHEASFTFAVDDGAAALDASNRNPSDTRSQERRHA